MSSPRPTGFQPGAKVICLHDRFPQEARPHFTCLPQANHIYTIRHVAMGRHWRTGAPGPHLILEECPRRSDSEFNQPGFLLARFRLLADHTALLSQKHHHRRPHRLTADR